jgi:hypothetical protein
VLSRWLPSGSPKMMATRRANRRAARARCPEIDRGNTTLTVVQQPLRTARSECDSMTTGVWRLGGTGSSLDERRGGPRLAGRVPLITRTGGPKAISRNDLHSQRQSSSSGNEAWDLVRRIPGPAQASGARHRAASHRMKRMHCQTRDRWRSRLGRRRVPRWIGTGGVRVRSCPSSRRT